MSNKFRLALKKDPTLGTNANKRKQFFRWTNKGCEGRTRQEFKNQCDINRIIDKFTITGVLPFAGSENLGIYADVSELPDFKSSLEFVIHAKESFEKLNVNVRKRFHNSPQELLDFLKDPENKAEARKLGLLKPEIKPPSTPAQPAPETPPV